jgi:hypothetical protein
MIIARVGRFPEDFTRELTAYLASIRGEPRLGVWSPGVRPPHDFAALAAWVHRDDAVYLREFLASRREGPHRWTNYAAERGLPVPWLEWLALPGVAYARLALIAELTDEEWSAWCDSVGQEPIERVDLRTGETRLSCGCSDGSPVGFEDMRDRWPLTVPGGCLRCESRAGGAHPVSFSHDGRRYRVNGAAAADPRNAPIDPIWAPNPEIEGSKISIGDLIQRGLALCE